MSNFWGADQCYAAASIFGQKRLLPSTFQTGALHIPYMDSKTAFYGSFRVHTFRKSADRACFDGGMYKKSAFQRDSDVHTGYVQPSTHGVCAAQRTCSLTPEAIGIGSHTGLLQETHLVGLVEHFGDVFDAHLGVDALAVGVDGVHGEEEALCNLGGRQAFGT